MAEARARPDPRFPSSVNERSFTLETSGRHVWRPIAPLAHVEVDFDAPNLAWRGTGYFDANAGAEPLERGFSDWTWSRAALDDEAAILYDAHRRREGPLSLALRFDRSGRVQPFAPPPEVDLPATRWRMARRTRSESGQAEIARDFEDAPFYSRSLVNARWLGRDVATMHESLSLERFAHPLVRCMLPFRMPRR